MSEYRIREYRYACAGCGANVRTFLFVNYRTIPPSIVKPTRCEACRSQLSADPAPASAPADADLARRVLFARDLLVVFVFLTVLFVLL